MNNFKNISKIYDNSAFLQKNIANDLFKSFFSNQYFQNVVDLGCGTGFLGEKFINHTDKITFVDLHQEMLNECMKKIQKNADFIQCDINNSTELIKIINKDTAVVSSMSFQWLDNLSETIDIIYNNSKIFAFAIPIVGTCYDFYNLFDFYGIKIKKFNFKTEEEMLSIVEKYNSKYFIKEYKYEFENIKDLLKYLKKIGVNYSAIETKNRINIKHFLKHKNKIIYNYNIFFCLVS